MKRALGIVLFVALLVAGLSDITPAAVSRGGGMSTSQASDTTWTWSPPVTMGVDIVNPDASCEFAFWYGGVVRFTTVLTGNSSKFFHGQWDSVTANPSTTQQVGVYGVDSN